MDTKKNILIIEDDIDLRDILTQQITHAGYKVYTATTAEEGLHSIQNIPIDLILLDIGLPDMDGISFYYEMTEKHQKNIPTIILTNKDHVAYQAGIKEFINKSNTSIQTIIEKIQLYIV